LNRSPLFSQTRRPPLRNRLFTLELSDCFYSTAFPLSLKIPCLWYQGEAPFFQYARLFQLFSSLVTDVLISLGYGKQTFAADIPFLLKRTFFPSGHGLPHRDLKPFHPKAFTLSVLSLVYGDQYFYYVLMQISFPSQSQRSAPPIYGYGSLFFLSSSIYPKPSFLPPARRLCYARTLRLSSLGEWPSLL